VVIIGHGGKIEFDNTLEERLRLLESAALPNIRASIFGYIANIDDLMSSQNEARKFFD
jgi:V-type H+-transporting ATPase subunit E